jgi:mono/diheme cytochrome c family protein
MEIDMKIQHWMKWIVLSSCLAVFFLTLTFSSAVSAEKKGNQAKGRFYFRQTCKNCHTKGADGGEITPLSKTMAQWEKYFVAAKHSKGTEPLSKVMSSDQINDVHAYLVEHAADSLQPETCGK